MPTQHIRINCGSGSSLTDAAGQIWLEDQLLAGDSQWGSTGGKTTSREEWLPIAGTDTPSLYRSERFGDEVRYIFPGLCSQCRVRLYFAETYDSAIVPGHHIFDVRINGQKVVSAFDPWLAGSGFAKAVTVDITGIESIDGRITLEIIGVGGRSAVINAIEILDGQADVFSVTTTCDAPDISQAPQPDPGKPLKRMLFAGNSFNFFWAIPETVETMVNNSSADFALASYRCLKGGARFKTLRDETPLLEKLSCGGYDWVSLQPSGRDLQNKIGIALADKVRQSGAKPFLYMPYIWKEAWDQHEDLARDCFELAKQMNAQPIPVGPAWNLALQRRNDITLYNIDGVHSGMYGGFLIANVFYASLTGLDPAKHLSPTILGHHVPVGGEICNFLQEIAWETVQSIQNR